MEDTQLDTKIEIQESSQDLERAKYCFRGVLKRYRDINKNVKHDSKDKQEISFGDYTLKYLPFILKRVNKKYIQHHRRYSYEDLLDEALLASLVAEKRYKPELGYDFSTYSKYDIEGALSTFTSSLSNTQLTLFNKLIKFIDSYSSKNGKHPSKTSILSGLKISEEKYNNLLQDLEPPCIVPYMSISNEDTGQEEEVGVEHRTPEDDLVITDILGIIAKLEEPIKSLIEMSVIQEMSIDSIATYLGVSKSQAQGSIDSAKAELRDILELHGIHE